MKFRVLFRQHVIRETTITIDADSVDACHTRGAQAIARKALRDVEPSQDSIETSVIAQLDGRRVTVSKYIHNRGDFLLFTRRRRPGWFSELEIRAVLETIQAERLRVKESWNGAGCETLSVRFDVSDAHTREYLARAIAEDYGGPTVAALAAEIDRRTAGMP